MTQLAPAPIKIIPSAFNLQDPFARLKEKVLVKRPILQGILRKKGDKKLLDYANEYVDVNLNPPILKRQNELLETVREMTTERFGSTIADSVVRQLEKYYFVSTGDHMGPITNPFSVNANLLTSVAMAAHTDPDLQNIIVLPCANVSLNNHTFPRGLLFHARGRDGVQEHRLSFLPSTAHAASAYQYRAYKAEEVQKVKKTLHEKVRNGEVQRSVADQINTLLEEVYNRPELFECSSYREQVAKTNIALWRRFFGGSPTLPNLINLEQEDMVVRLLTKYHLEQDTVLNHILFDPLYEPFISNYFEGIYGSFSRPNASGTYLFWARPAGGKINKQLWPRGNKLVTEDGSYSVELRPDTLRKAMESRELIPSLLLNFMTISFYYGLKCLGGFNQVNYLTFMKNAYIKMNVDLGNYRSIEVCARAQTREICTGLSVAFLGSGEKTLRLADGLDLILYGQPDSWRSIANLCQEITLEEALNPLLPEMYRISYDHNELEEELLGITSEDINRLTGLQQKIRPCVSIPE